MRFAMLAMGKSRLSPESVEAELELMRGAHASMQIALLSGHQDAVDSAAFSPVGRRVVTASADQTVRAWAIRWLMENRGGSLAEAVCKEKLVGAKLLATGDEAALSLVRGRKGENVCGS
ncbi:WD40 repeat domain-containing protein [Paraburkholderia hospita]|uniref:WD40 repeat domain-containing protein n=1 Tax=Paraburkholderia hospita TaxID=169430 RepID=UPI001F25F843|nr:WD40 repeat domain-containing protein [Paraburkholderia hospita]